MTPPAIASAAGYNVPVLLFNHQRRQAYLHTNNEKWPSYWLPAMGSVIDTFLPHHGSDYSPEFATYIQFLREKHLMFFELEIFLANIEPEDTGIGPDSGESPKCIEEFSYGHICLHMPGHLTRLSEYWTHPGFVLLDRRLYSSTSLVALEEQS